MELYLLRHGIAEAQSLTGRDFDRRLTPGGSAEARVMLTRALGSGARPELILTSPLKRTLETAQIAVAVFGYKEEVVKANALVPESNPADVWAEIQCYPEAKSILLVTHEPLVSQTLAWLLGVSRAGSGFPASGIACVDMQSGPPGVLRYMYTPDGLRRA